MHHKFNAYARLLLVIIIPQSWLHLSNKCGSFVSSAQFSYLRPETILFCKERKYMKFIICKTYCTMNRTYSVVFGILFNLCV